MSERMLDCHLGRGQRKHFCFVSVASRRVSFQQDGLHRVLEASDVHCRQLVDDASCPGIIPTV